jgi:hypothetical protein
MRSIGKKNRNLVIKTTKEAIKRRTTPWGEENFVGIDEEIIEKLPEELWDIWEMADQEIRGLIHDTIMDDE